MSWTQGQPNRANQSPLIDHESENRNQKPATSHNYAKSNGRRNDYNERQPQFTPSAQPSNVAATFTQEGLQTFSLIFSSAVEAAIAKSLPDIVERAVERKLQDVIDQAKSEINRLTTDLVSQIIQQTETTIETRLYGRINDRSFKSEESISINRNPLELHEASPETTMNTVMSTDNDPLYPQRGSTNHTPTPDAAKSRRESRLSEEVNIVIQTLKDLDRPAKTDELRSLAPSIEWGSNPSVKMTNLINKSNGQIKRTGRGVYEYKAVSD